MKWRVRLAASAAVALAALVATSAGAQSVTPCTVYLCMAGLSGEGATGGAGCTAATGLFFSLVVFDPYFDPPATALLRRRYLMVCPGAQGAANAAVLDAIIAAWGYVP